MTLKAIQWRMPVLRWLRVLPGRVALFPHRVLARLWGRVTHKTMSICWIFRAITACKQCSLLITFLRQVIIPIWQLKQDLLRVKAVRLINRKMIERDYRFCRITRWWQQIMAVLAWENRLESLDKCKIVNNKLLAHDTTAWFRALISLMIWS